MYSVFGTINELQLGNDLDASDHGLTVEPARNSCGKNSGNPRKTKSVQPVPQQTFEPCASRGEAKAFPLKEAANNRELRDAGELQTNSVYTSL